MLLVTDSVMDIETEHDSDVIDSIERRRGLRVRQARSVKVYDANAARYFGGQTEDISATGLRIELPSFAPVQPGDMLSIHVGLNDRGQALANRRHMLPARVVWVNREDRRIRGRVEVGVEFLAGIAAHLDAA
ncbi:MAG TPA: PilZ domain-containing protein [Tepidisphaeraceae bacterium]|jgi:c-di-GMP-binding flagellar brake protein YcgR